MCDTGEVLKSTQVEKCISSSSEEGLVCEFDSDSSREDKDNTVSCVQYIMFLHRFVQLQLLSWASLIKKFRIRIHDSVSKSSMLGWIPIRIQGLDDQKFKKIHSRKIFSYLFVQKLQFPYP